MTARSLRPRAASSAAALFAATLLTSCELPYLARQGFGQLGIARGSEAICVETTRELSATARERLAWVPTIRRFARDELGLDPGDAYETLYDTSGNPITTIVLAAHPTALEPYRWCFPIVGCVPYKGFFDPIDAHREAFELRQDGWDVVVLSAAAYSTLGWFRDPVLSTMLETPLPNLVELLIHELAHRTVYYPGDTTANESLATHVAQSGTRRFFERFPDSAPPEEWRRYFRSVGLRKRDEALVERLRRDLRELYSTENEPDQIQKRKVEVFRTARRARAALHGRSVALPASNAYVLVGANYHALVPEFRALQSREGGHPGSLMAYLKERRKESAIAPVTVAGAGRALAGRAPR